MISDRSKKRVVIRAEDRLLLSVGRVCEESKRTETITKLVRAGLNWEAAIEAALHHGMLPLLYWQLVSICPELVPSPILERLRTNFLDSTRSNLLLASELLEILHCLEAHSIPAIPFKGPVLAVAAYGNLALRQFGDLDILLHKKDFPRAKDLLTEMGYQSQYPLAKVQENAYLQSLCQLPMMRRDGLVMVELHTQISPRDFAFPLDFETLWTRMELLSLCDQEVMSLSGEDLLLILCTHGAKHCWASLGWICDIAWLIAARPNIDWERLLEQSKQLRCDRMLLLGLCLSNEWFGATPPEEILQKIKSQPIIETLAANVAQWLFWKPMTVPGGLASALFHLKVRENLRDSIRYSLSIPLAPTLADWMVLSLPSWLSFLYYPLRAVRLVNKYGSKVQGLKSKV